MLRLLLGSIEADRAVYAYIRNLTNQLLYNVQTNMLILFWIGGRVAMSKLKKSTCYQAGELYNIPR